MTTFNDDMIEFKKQIEKGHIQTAYKGLMGYIMSLRSHLSKNYPNFQVPNTIYFGYMDMTYFPIFTEKLKEKKLKIAVVFNYEHFRFEVWLSAVNKDVLTNYWKLIKDISWDKYHVVKPGKGIDSILEYNVVETPDFSNLDVLTKEIEKGTIHFIKDVENFLIKDF